MPNTPSYGPILPSRRNPSRCQRVGEGAGQSTIFLTKSWRRHLVQVYPHLPWSVGAFKTFVVLVMVCYAVSTCATSKTVSNGNRRRHRVCDRRLARSDRCQLILGNQLRIRTGGSS